jgi:hypothetical protein
MGFGPEVDPETPAVVFGTAETGGAMNVALVVLLAFVFVFIGLGFLIKWLFIVAVTLAVVWLFGYFTGRSRSLGSPIKPSRNPMNPEIALLAPLTARWMMPLTPYQTDCATLLM